MSEIPKTVEIPRYLLTGRTRELTRTEPFGEDSLVAVPNMGFIDIDDETKTKEIKKLYNRGQFFQLPYSLKDRDFTLEISFKGSCNPIRFAGDNKELSNTSIVVSNGTITLYNWGSYWQRQFWSWNISRWDELGITHYTLLKKDKTLYHYIMGELVWTNNITNHLDSDEIYLANGNYELHRFAFTPDVTIPPELMYIDSNVYGQRDGVQKNISLVTDIYDSRSFENKMVVSFVSYGNWLYVKFNDGTMKAFMRPRGVDSGVTLKNADYDFVNNVLILTDTNDKEYRLNVEENIEENSKPPAGTGILSIDGIHKPLEDTETVRTITLESVNTTLNKSTASNPIESTKMLSSKEEILTTIDYMKRIVLEENIRNNSRDLNIKAPVNDWSEISDFYSFYFSDLAIAEMKEDSIFATEGTYLLKGFINRYGLTSDYFGIELRCGEAVIFSKMFSVKNALSNAGINQFQFFLEELITIPSNKKITIWQFMPSDNSGDITYVQMVNPITTSRLELFKV